MVAGARQRTAGAGKTLAFDLSNDQDVRTLATHVERQEQEPVAVFEAGVGIGDETLAVQVGGEAGAEAAAVDARGRQLGEPRCQIGQHLAQTTAGGGRRRDARSRAGDAKHFDVHRHRFRPKVGFGSGGPGQTPSIRLAARRNNVPGNSQWAAQCFPLRYSVGGVSDGDSPKPVSYRRRRRLLQTNSLPKIRNMAALYCTAGLVKKQLTGDS